MNRVVILSILIFVLAVQASWAQIPETMCYQGVLTDASGTPVPDGAYELTFSIYDVDTGGVELWSESHSSVAVGSGLFTVVLGSINPLDIPFDKQYWLGVAVGAGAELIPRTQLTSSAYSLGGNFWRLSGNSGTNATTNFLGTIDNQALELRINNLRALLLEPNAISPNFIGGFDGNSVTSGVFGATIGGGGAIDFMNLVTDNFGTIGGGSGNEANRIYATIGGGMVNVASGKYATIGGGDNNAASGGDSTIAGGKENEAIGTEAAVGGGRQNAANGAEGNTIAGGVMNATSDDFATIGGGLANVANGEYSTVGGGYSNTAAIAAIVGGGSQNTASGSESTVGGGGSNIATGDNATVGGGLSNTASGKYSTIAGGKDNEASGTEAATVGGGRQNAANGGDGSTIAGGVENATSDDFATIGGGLANVANGEYSTVGGGYSNTAGVAGTVGGGSQNAASGFQSTVGGGDGNTAGGEGATVPGGQSNAAQGVYSFAAGQRAKANHNGSFVWGDSTYDDVASTGDNQFIARASGGVFLYTNSGLTSGVYVASGGNSWNFISDRVTKENLIPVNREVILEKLAALPIQEYNLKSQASVIRHIGPVAQDFSAVFGYGESDRAINMEDADGVALAAIQCLYKLVKEKDAKIAELEARLRALEELVSSTQGQSE